MKIRDVYEAGSSDDGLTVRLNITKDDGLCEWLELPAANVGKLIAALIFSSGVAAKNRPPVKDMLGTPIELSSMIDIESCAATSSPGLTFVAIRMTLAPDVHLDFRLPLGWVDPMKVEIDRATLLARSSDRPAGVH